MKRNQRIVSAVLLLALVLTLFSGLTVYAAGLTKVNTGIRHQTCTQLSQQALDYYRQENTSYELLSALEGDSSGSSLKAVDSELYAALHVLMESTMTNSVSYSSLTSYWPTTDATNGSDDAVLFYSDYVSGGYNREHVWPKSRGSFYQSKAGSDLHHLRPTDTNVNSTRGNLTMGNVRGVISDYRTYRNGGKDVLYYATANDLVEINDNIKGDVARIFLYVYVRWEEPNLFENDPNPKQASGDTGGNNGLKVIESLDTLLQWCEKDPVDDWEMQRNDLCQDVQGNRNVFIDYPELAWLLFDEEIPTDMQTPSGEAQNGGVGYTVTALSENPDLGSVSLSGRTITAVPAEGYYATGAVVTPAGAATVTQNGNVFRLSEITADCTVTVSFGKKAAATVAYRVPAGVSVNGPTSGYIGDEITLPQVSGTPADSARDYTFAGWATGAVSDTTDRASFTLYEAGSSCTLNAPATTFYAVYSYKVVDGEPADANTFRLVTQAQADWSGDYVITGTAGSTDYALLADGSLTGTGIASANAAVPFADAGIEKNGDLLESVARGYVVTLEKSGSAYTISLKGAETPVYLAFPTNGKNTMTTATDPTDPTAQWTVGFDGGSVTITNVATPSRFMQFNASSYMFRCYTAKQTSLKVYGAVSSSETHYLTIVDETVCDHSHTETHREEATCEKSGSVTVVCTDCGETVSTAVLPALGHDMVVDAGVPATCEESGLTEGKHCSRCDSQTVKQEVIPALGHKYGAWTVTKKAGCTTTGVETRACERCGIEESRSIPALGHTMGQWKDAGDGKTHIHVCGTCGVTESQDHEWDEGVITEEPTETETGVKTYTCEVCGGTKTETIPCKPTEPTEPEVTEPTIPETTEPEVTEPEATEPEVTVPETTEPEATEPEVTEPETTEPETTVPEATEDPNAPPQTGDAAPLLLWTLLLAISLAGMAVILRISANKHLIG